MYYVKTRADNSGYTNHRVICLVVIGSSFDSEQVFQVSFGYCKVCITDFSAHITVLNSSG
jgi:hypothetical protein